MRAALLGETLTGLGYIDEEECRRALAIGRNTRTRLGDILLGEGMIGYRPLYEALAGIHNLPFADLLTEPPDARLLDADFIHRYVAERAIPYRMEGGTLIVATAEYGPDTIRAVKEKYGDNVGFVMTSPLDIHRSVQALFAQELTHKSVFTLYEKAPASSARTRGVLRLLPAISLVAILVAGALWWSLWGSLLLFFAACHIVYGVTMGFKLVLYLAGLNPPPPAPEKNISDEDLPVYTVLIPMYREVESLPHMLDAMRAMDYPAAKLDIKLIFEADDHETIAAAQALKPRYQFEIVRVPESQPRTKPKACNYALRFARGDFVTVYDADDRPDPRQLKKAVSAFRAAPSRVVCLQARLNYYNTHDNWLTRLFSLEYAMLFHVLLPGLYHLKMPVMLGGTSNHISLSRLRELGEWDPFNVTEDADLGTRLAERGYLTRMLDSDTMEEAPNTIGAWMSQRTRWIKGYMQTWLVHMRAPLTLARGLGLPGFIGFQCFVALSSLSYLLAPVSWLVAICWFIDSAPAFPDWLYTLALINLALNVAIHIGTALHITLLYPQKRAKMAASAVLYPFYLVLHSAASYLAVWQLLVKPYVWNKTTHGKAKTFMDFQLTRPH